MANTTGPSNTVLDGIAARGLKLMAAVSINPYIRAALNKRGYTNEIHQRGWTLVMQASGYRTPPAGAAPERPEAVAAIAELDAWDEPNFRVARAALAHEFPEQCELVFQDLEPQTGAGAVVSISTFLDRLDLLKDSKDRKATRKADHAALAKLAERGITADERARLRGLIQVALGSPDDSPVSVRPDPNAETERRAAQLELWKFHSEWSEVLRADVKRRDHLIQAGLATRKVSKKKEP